MTTYVAVLYSIILPAGKRLVMSDLRAMATDLGLRNPRTLVATGNLVFEAPRQKEASLEARLEPAFAERFGKHIDHVVRTGEDWRRLAAGNPFRKESETEPSRVAVRVMRNRLPAAAEKDLLALCGPDDKVRVIDGDVWIYTPEGISLSKVFREMTPKRQGIGTLRNVNTVNGIVRLLDARRGAARTPASSGAPLR